MGLRLYPLLSYIRFWFKSGNEHGLHSPFVYELYTEVIRSHKQYYAFEEIEAIRDELRTDHTPIALQDMGARGAGREFTTRSSTTGRVAARASVPAHIGELLFKLVIFFRPNVIFELGTSLGLSSLYLFKAHPEVQLYTFEGDPSCAAIARKLFDRLSGHSISLLQGNIDVTLPEALAAKPRIDMAFVDANHRYQPTVHYFEQLLACSHEHTVLIFDDIHWSAEMEEAWEYIKAHPSVTLSIDLYRIGLVFFRKTQSKQHFILRL